MCPHAHELASCRFIPEDVVAGWCLALWRADGLLRFLRNKRGLSLDTLVRWELGWDGFRVTIPIRGWHGEVVNARCYRPHATADTPKIISYRRGYGEARLWPPSSVWGQPDEPIVLCEGEMDTLVALQAGLRALTSTGGARSFAQGWVPWFASQRVWIAYDRDRAGAAGAARVADLLAGTAAEVRILRLPVPRSGKDMTDLFLAIRNGEELCA